MRCVSCVYGKMCRLRARYRKMIHTIGHLTGTREPAYQEGCDKAAALYDSCIHYEAKP